MSMGCTLHQTAPTRTRPVPDVQKEGTRTMATYVNLDGVRTWYDETGTGDPLVLLHPGGGGVDSRAFGPNLAALTPFPHLHPGTARARPHPRRRRPDHLRGDGAGHDRLS
jgi:hypothetical protein